MTVGPEKEHDCFLTALQSVIVHPVAQIPAGRTACDELFLKSYSQVPEHKLNAGTNASPPLHYVCFSIGTRSIFFVIPVIHSRVQRESLSLAPERKPSRQWSEFKVVDRLVEVFASLLTKVSNESWPRVWRFRGGRFQSEGDG